MNASFLPEINWIDIIVLILLIRGCYIGYYEGFSVEIFKTLGAIVTAAITLLYYRQPAQWLVLHSFLHLPVAKFLSVTILTFSLLIVAKVVRVFAFKVLHLELFGNLERWGGFIFGLVRGIVFASLFIFAIRLLPGEYIKESVEKQSFSGPCLKDVAPKALDFMRQFKPKSEETE